MNIFFLALAPKECAQLHCDKHVVKMILETAQLLELAHQHMGSSWANHPCAKWARESKANYHWLCMLGMELCTEYTRRYHKVHAYKPKFDSLIRNVPDLPNVGITRAPIVVAADCLIPGHLVDSYRQYYRLYKRHFAVWTSPSEEPEWMQLPNSPI